MTSKKCIKCDEYKPYKDFYRDFRMDVIKYRGKCKLCSKDGGAYNRRSPEMKAKNSKSSKAWKKNNPTKAIEWRKEYINKKSTLGDVYIKHSISAALSRAKAKGYTNYDTKEKLLEYLKKLGGVPEYCPILGIKLVYGGGSSENSPSLDRIDVTKGYTVGNVWFISARANMIKNDASFKELQKFSKYFIDNFTSWGKKRKK